MSHTVTLRPSLSAGIETYLFQGQPTWNYGIAGWIIAGGWAASQPNKALLQFDLSSLPAGAVVTSATLILITQDQQSTVASNIDVHRGLVQWYEGNSSGAVPAAGINASTWNLRNVNGSIPWAGGAGGAAGTEYVSAATATASVNGVNTLAQWTVTADVAAWVAGTASNFGWWITGPSTANSAKSFYADNSGANAPTLLVTYNISEVAAPTARFAVAGNNGPTGIVLGSTVKTPTPIFAVAGELAPTVGVGYGSPGAVVDAGSDVVAPTVVVGGMTSLGSIAGARGSSLLDGVQLALTASPAFAVAGRNGPTATIKGSMVLTPTPATAFAEIGGLASLVDLSLVPVAAGANGSTAVHVVAMRIFPETCDPRPLLYITDGTVKSNGQNDLLSFIDRNNGFVLTDWAPTVAQYKDGGTFSNSPRAEGRRLTYRTYDNAIETFELTLKGHDVDSTVQFLIDLFDWQERSADYWTADWSERPVYLVKKAPRETGLLYAPVHVVRVPGLKNPYVQPFFSRDGKPRMEQLSIQVERGHWQSSPPGNGECVQVSSTRSWTIQGWQQGNTTGGGGGTTVDGSVRALIQAKNGDVLAGTNSEAKIYRSTDNGATWFFVTKLGSAVSGTDTVNAFTKDYAGNIYAAVSGGSGAEGIWKSTNNGASWTKVKTHPTAAGYRDITYVQSNSTLVAIGYATNSNQSPVTLSWDLGVTWTDPLMPHYYYNGLSVAAADLPGLVNELPGVTPVGPEAFFGFDSFYTLAGRAGRSNGGFAKETASGQMGNGGLDMAAYGYARSGSDSSQGLGRRALWAVKSAANTSDTEIWQWPNPVNATDNFGKIATISGKTFNVLYVDPTASLNTATVRTIWAGANGEVYVSYNSGYSWSLATTAPVNQVRSFVRTTAGTLLAGGDSGEIFTFTGTSGTEGGGVGVGGAQAGGTVVNSYPLGREATCNDEVFASNKSSFTNITHVLHYNGSTYSNLQFSTQPPYTLLGTNPTVNKAAYFGSQTSDTNVPGGPFSSVIFDLTQIAENLTVVWEYWNGSAWTALTVQDSSSGFRVLGVGSVHWAVPSNWATVVVNSVTGYWVRARVSAVGTGPVYPIHANRYIYTANLPYIEIAEEEVSGDLPANGQIRWHNRADDPGATLDLEVDRVICGLRRVDRGNFFNAYLNISDTQVPFGFSIAKTTDGAWVINKRAATSRALQVTPTAPGLNVWEDLVSFSISNSVAKDYYGTYRAFLRCFKNGATAHDWQVRLRVSFGSGGATADTTPVFPTTLTDWELVDLGQVSIPSTQVSQVYANQGDLLNLSLQGKCSLLSSVLNLYDLVLIPVDEWAADTKSPQLTTSDTVKIRGGNYVDIDSITNPKVSISAFNRNPANQIVGRYQVVNNGPVMLQKRSQQRLWFLTVSYENYWRSQPEMAGSVTVNKQQKYLGMRGRS